MEIEAKFTIADLKTWRKLDALDELAGFALSEKSVRKVHDTYLDTAAQSLRSAGYACRRREMDGEITITVKQLQPAADAIHRREEFEIQLVADQPPEEWESSPARDLVLQLVGDQPLARLFDLRQTRIVRAMIREAQPIAQWSLDAVRVRAGKRTFSFRELEIELTSGNENDLAAMVARLKDEWKLPAEPRPKFMRALEFVNATRSVPPAQPSAQARAPKASERHAARPKTLTKPKIESDDAMAEAARKTLLFQFQQMVAHEAGTRAGEDIEELHDMRVATRRMRAALQLFDRYLEHRTYKPFAKSLRRAGRTLGAVRDLDVFRVKAQQYVAQLPAERQTELEPLFAVWQSHYDAAREDLLVYLDGDKYTCFKNEFGEFLQTPGAGAAPVVSRDDEPLPHRVRHVLPSVIFEHVAQVRAFDEWMTVPDVALTRYHQLRIASKGLRYTLEFFREVLGAEVEGLIEQTKQLQDHLGSLQDTVVACNVLRSLLMWGTWEQGAPRKKLLTTRGMVAPGIAAYLAARQSEIQELVNTFPPVWRPISSEEFSRQLALLAAL